MNIRKLVVGELETNCYLIEKDGKSLIIDPGDEYSKIKQFVKSQNLIGILITHNHFDHIGCVADLVKDYSIPVYDNSNLNEGENSVDIFKFKVIRTYGHSMDSISFYFESEKVMFTGDFLFKAGIGRTDLPGGSMRKMLDSLEVIKNYPDDIIVYPGHFQNTTIGIEKERYFLTENTEER